MNLSLKGTSLLAEWEGSEPHVYLDSGGVATIGVGHVLTPSERKSGKICIGKCIGDYREGLTEEQIQALLLIDVAKREQAVNQLVKVPLTQNQFDTLVSFVFNVGREAFANSTLLRLLNTGDYASIPEQLKRWNRDNGVTVLGLTHRRAKEIALWEESDATTQETFSV